MKICETDNFGGDFPAEVILPLPSMGALQAGRIAHAINAELNPDGHGPRWWRVVEDTYIPLPGFEP